MSQITEIIKAVGNMEVNTIGKTPIVFGLENAKDSINSTPARVVFPIQTGDNEGRDMNFLTLGSLVSVVWTLADLMLYKPVKSGGTLQSATPELTAYIGNYITAMKDNRKLGLQYVTVESVEYEFNRFEFPEGSNNEYYGALVMLTVKEIVP